MWMSPDFGSAEVAAAHRFHMRGTATMIFIIYFLMILTYQEFFLFDPTSGESLAREISLWIALFGWISATFLSPLSILGVARGSKNALRLMPYLVLFWPISIITAQITVYAETGVAYIDYLFKYPVFVITDIALPIFLMVKWNNVRRSVLKAGYELY
jgi:hypothetical protein